MGRRGLTGRLRLSWLVRAMVVLAGVINVLVATVHSWPDAVFFGGFLALLPTEVRMIYLVRVRKTRAARWPLFIAAAGVFASVIMMSRKPQPLIATGCVDIAVAAAAWGVYFLITHALAGSAAKPDSGDRGDTPA